MGAALTISRDHHTKIDPFEMLVAVALAALHDTAKEHIVEK